jgi:hypothetical protein
MTIILQTWPMQNRLASSGFGQSVASAEFDREA